MKMLPDKYKVVTATVDELAGEIGTIYQACNFTYIGSMRENNPKVNDRDNDRFGVEIKGKLYGARSIRQKLGKQKKEEIQLHNAKNQMVWKHVFYGEKKFS